jgi:cysteine synthase A
VGGLRIYFAGVTECIPEMLALRDIDVAFIPMNLPHGRMVPTVAADCVLQLAPRVVFPYHYREMPIDDFVAALRGSPIDVRLHNWYPPSYNAAPRAARDPTGRGGNAMLEPSAMGRTFESILETVGRTPAVRVNRLAPPGVDLYVKVEAFNPLGSVKDRLALGVIEAAEASGELKPGQTVIEATSGNTGIGLAMVCAAKGYPLVLVMAETFSIERRRLMRFLGAKVVITPAADRAVGMLGKTKELAEKHGWFMTRQFENEANAAYHSRTTAREILADFEGRRLDYWVTGYGTGGTLKGVGRVLRKERPETKIVVCEPEDAPLLGSGVEQARNADGTPASPHPAFKPHPMQGWTPDFVPKLTGDAIAMGLSDSILAIPNAHALAGSKELAAKEGIFVGISSGGTFAGALRVAEQAEKGSTILCMLPDTGERYLSTPLFADVPVDMTDEELAIARSTPSAQLNP